LALSQFILVMDYTVILKHRVKPGIIIVMLANVIRGKKTAQLVFPRGRFSFFRGIKETSMANPARAAVIILATCLSSQAALAAKQEPVAAFNWRAAPTEEQIATLTLRDAILRAFARRTNSCG